MRAKSEWDMQCELEYKTCDALLLQFDPEQIIKSDFYIPSPTRIREWTVDFDRKTLQQSVRDKLWEVLQRGSAWNEPTNCILEDYLLRLGGITWSGRRTEGNWIYMFGDLFRFKEGQREEAQRDYQDHWNEAERKDFDRIGIVLRDKVKVEYGGRK